MADKQRFHEYMRDFRKKAIAGDQRRLYEGKARECEGEETREIQQVEYHYKQLELHAGKAREWKKKAREFRKLASEERIEK